MGWVFTRNNHVHKTEIRLIRLGLRSDGFFLLSCAEGKEQRGKSKEKGDRRTEEKNKINSVKNVILCNTACAGPCMDRTWGEHGGNMEGEWGDFWTYIVKQ